MSVPSTIRIRPMTAKDIDRVVELAAGLDDAPHWDRRVYEAAVDRSSPRRAALVSEDAETGALAGFAIASLVPPEAELESIAVSREYQRRGVARTLFEALAAELDTSGVREVLLEVRESNRPARALYLSLGFIETGRRHGYYADPVEDAIQMRFEMGARQIPER